MIPKSFIQDLLNRVDIIDVIERHVPLKKNGANFVACCPFHSEKTPSFTVSPSKQFYHCFGCGVSGTAIGFLIEYSGLGFVEAVKELSAAVGMQVPEERDSGFRIQDSGKGSTNLAEIMQQACSYYRKQLKTSPQAIAYLKQRGLTGEIAARFLLGYAPTGWQNLSEVFNNNYADKALVECGLVIQGEEGKRYDRFRDRIIFPIINQRGAVIGFGGRVIGDGEPKYLNSPETPLFEKGHELYGLPQARHALRTTGSVLVVEGYMDVVALAQHGVEYAVATLGTATTSWQVQKLLRQAESVIFCFDGDEAGKKAAWRALEVSIAQLQDDKRISFLFLPEDEDPDSFIRSRGKAAFETLLKEALPLSQYLMQGIGAGLDLGTAEGRSRLIHNAKPFIKQLNAPALTMQLVNELAKLCQMSSAEIESLCDIKQGGKKGMREMARALPRKAPSLLRKLLQYAVLKPDFTKTIDPILLDVKQQEARVLLAMQEASKAWPHTSTAAIMEYFRGSEHEQVLKEVSSAVLEMEGVELEVELAGAVKQLKLSWLDQQIDALSAEERSQGLSSEKARQFADLIHQKQALRNLL